MKGWLFCQNMECSFLKENGGQTDISGKGILYTYLDNKFYHDKVFDPAGFFLDGYITNKQELLQEAGENLWDKVYKEISKRDDFPNMLRGSFCGYFRQKGESLFFTDHTGSKALFYYYYNEKLIVSTRLKWITDVLQHNGVKYHFDENAAKYMLTYGFMLDDTTFVSEIKRILPGYKVSFLDGKTVKNRYYIPTIKNLQDISENEAVKLIDVAFKKAVKREFDKDREYGYKHLVDLSGGLDSRMVTWAAHESGYENQTNFTYCKADYLDYKISSQIAAKLQHEYYFKQLDDFQWIYSIDEILELNSGTALYSGITGGSQFLSMINSSLFGIEHTGMIGDVIVSCFAENEGEAYKEAEFGCRQYSTILKYNYPPEILKQYENQEIFDLYTRGFLGAMSTYSIRQNYVEVASPFLDVDFIDVCFSIPVKYRLKHRIYLEWLKQCYKDSTNFGWEKWAGVYPRKEFAVIRDAAFAIRKLKRSIRGAFGYKISDNMNPFDYWYSKDEKAREFYGQYFESNINRSCLTETMRKDITKLFLEGNASEKSQALTVLGMAKLCFSEEMR